MSVIFKFFFGSGGFRLVFVDSEETHAVELWQLGNETEHESRNVDQKVVGVVFGVEARQNESNHREKKVIMHQNLIQ